MCLEGIEVLKRCQGDLSPYYTLHLSHVALAIKPNEMKAQQMKCTCNANDSTYITLFFQKQILYGLF